MNVDAAFVSKGIPKDENVETLAPWSKRVSTTRELCSVWMKIIWNHNFCF